jgi:endonuclease/exonuclease/phosphatase family metal-dependent hydrolase
MNSKSRYQTPIRSVLWKLLTALVCGTIWAQAADTVSAGKDSLCVMTFNLRYASTNQPNSWADRRPVMRALLEKLSPDLLGTQEGLYYQLKELASDLPKHSWIGLGREGGSRGEFGAIFYRTERFDPLEFDHFWLSDTPSIIGSTTWGNKNRRMVTWAKFHDRKFDQDFFLFNTHFDHETPLARHKSAELLRRRIEELNTDLPVLVIGDFNDRATSSQTYSTLTANEFLKDAWLAAQTRRSDSVDTFHNYRPVRDTGFRIDWILSRGRWLVDAAEVVTFAVNGQFPSDHFPVAAWLRLPR